MDDNDCPGCGSSLVERQKYAAKGDSTLPPSTDLRQCPHCHSHKCCICDMGDDVECVSCE